MVLSVPHYCRTKRGENEMKFDANAEGLPGFDSTCSFSSLSRVFIQILTVFSLEQVRKQMMGFLPCVFFVIRSMEFSES